jgi:hypothetical protein
LKKVASESLNIFLAAMFRNPQDLFYPRSAKYLEADEGTYVCGVLEAFPPASAAGLLDEMRARFIARGGLSQYFDVFTSACHPTAKMAELYGGGVDQYGKHGQAWAPEPWLEDDVLKQLREGSLSWFLYSQLDYLPQDRIATALAGDAPFDAKDLFLAFHKVLRVGTAQNSFAIRYAARQTRPFAVILPNEWDGLGGALSGLLSVAIARDGQKAAIRATVDARPYYRGYCELATKIRNDCNLDAWLVRKFAVDPGKLIRRLEVRRAGVEVPVQETPGRSPGRAFSVALGPEGWKDTYLFVELALEAPATSVAAGGAPPPVPVITREFSFALFDTPEARAETWEAPR